MNHDGQERQRSGTHAVLWVGLAVVAAPVLYLLTLPVVVYVAMGASTAGSHSGMPPQWLMAYAKPAEWVATRTPLERPYQAYCEWCFNKLER